MDLGLAFDDDDLQCNEKDKMGDRHLPYNVKICTHKWYETALQDSKMPNEIEDMEQYQRKLKFSADCSYQEKDFTSAINKYERLLGMHSSKINSSLILDIQESLSRCLLHTGQLDRSLLIAREMVEAASREDEARQRQALALLAFASEKAHRWEECADALEKLCGLQPLFPQTFHKLGDAYSHLLTEGTKGSERTDAKVVRVKQLSCYLHAKHLFVAVMGTASEFIKDRNLSYINQLTKKIDQLPLSSSRKLFATTYIFQSVDKDEMKQVTNTKESSRGELPAVDVSTSVIFYNKFCSWDAVYQSGR